MSSFRMEIRICLAIKQMFLEQKRPNFFFADSSLRNFAREKVILFIPDRLFYHESSITENQAKFWFQRFVICLYLTRAYILENHSCKKKLFEHFQVLKRKKKYGLNQLKNLGRCLSVRFINLCIFMRSSYVFLQECCFSHDYPRLTQSLHSA